MSELSTHLRAAWRSLSRRPATTALLLATLTLSIGANTAIFAVARTVLLRPLPYDQPERLVMVWRAPREQPQLQGFRNAAALQRGISTPQMVGEYRARNTTFQDLAVVESWQGNLSAQMDVVGGAGAERLRGALVTPNFFATLGVSAALGRTFLKDDTGDLVVLSDGLWRRLFGADPAVVGRAIDLAVGRDRQRRAFTVVGVLAPRFQYSYPQDTEIWSLLTWDDVAKAPAQALLYQVVARLEPGVSLQAAQSDMDTVRDGMVRDFGRAYERSVLRLEPIHEYAVGRVRPALLLLSGITTLVLLVGCANVAALLLAQAVSRRRVIAVQRALGATRGRQIRQLLTEIIVLAVFAAVMSLVAIWGLQPLLASVLPPATPRLGELSIDLVTLAWTAGVMALTVLLAGLVPSIRGSSIDPNDELNEGARTTTGGRTATRWRNALTVMQVALLCTLLIGGGLLLRSLWNLQRVDLGFDGSRVTTMELRLLDRKYRDASRMQLFQDELLVRVRGIPGVTAASLTSAVPFRGVDFVVGGFVAADGSRFAGNRRHVEAGYFDVMGIPLVAGRRFTAQDNSSAAAVAIVSESMARRLFGDGPAVGQLLPLQGSQPEIVGVARDVRSVRVEDAAMPALYVPAAQLPIELVCVVIRTDRRSEQVAAAARAIVQAIDPMQPVQGVTTLEQLASDAIADQRFYAVTSVSLALIALLLAGAGLYGVTAYGVTERVREFGIRAAVGATPSALLVMVIRQGCQPVILGLGVGLVGAFWSARLIRQFLFGLSDVDPLTYAAVAVCVIVFAVAACYIPGRKAAALDASTALRQP